MNNPQKSYSVNASAGFGKTEDLTLRIITLLLISDTPEVTVREIVAMTFTKAAAGEIYERLLSMAYRALTEENGVELLKVRVVIAQIIKELDEEEFIAKLNDQQFQAELQAKRCSELSKNGQAIFNSLSFCNREKLTLVLKVLVQNMSSIKMSTIDSFMYNIVATFPFELGLPGRAELIETAESKDIVNAILARLFNLQTTSSNKSDYVEACREILTASNNKNVFEVFEEIINNLVTYSAYISDSEKWNHFQNFSHDIQDDELDRGLLTWQTFMQSDEYETLANKARTGTGVKIICQAIEKGATLSHANNFTADELRRINDIFSTWEDFPKSKGVTFLDKLDVTIQEAAGTLLLNIAEFQIRQANSATHSMRILLEEYTKIYTKELAQSGKITFADIPKLLSSQSNDWVNDINFRLNSKYKHWLIDEFQDTNLEQLSVLNEIIDDVQTGENSLYLVGDVKQAIYSWRGGDRYLMAMEGEKFGLIDTFLPFSYRYGKNICAALNSIFNLADKPLYQISTNFRTQWNTIWRTHYPANNTTAGVFEILAPNFSTYDGDVVDFHADIIVEKIKEQMILERGLNTAILVRNRKTGIKLREFLALNFPDDADRFVWEGDETIGADPLVAGLLSLLVYLHHPADKLCLGAVKMNQAVRHLIPEDEEAWANQIHQIATLGFHGTLISWLKQLHNISVVVGEQQHERYSASGNANISTLLLAAQNFDASTIVKDAIKFRDFVLEYKRQDSATSGSVKIMTIHKSKGLTFDAVFVPIVNAAGGKNVNWNALKYSELFAKTNLESRELDWLIYAPKAAGNTVEELRVLAENSRDDDIFEEFCLTYVALTRAKKIAIVLLPPLSKEKFKVFEKGTHLYSNCKSYYMSDFLFDTNFYGEIEQEEIGKHDMFVHRYNEFKEEFTLTKPSESKQTPAMILNLGHSQGRIPRATPAHSYDSWANLLRLPEVDSSANFGLQLHNLFEHVGNLAEYQLPKNMPEKLARHVGNCQANSEICQLISNHHHRIWQESSFELILNNCWITGRFDRVNITEQDGKVVYAEVIDFKSDFIAPEVDLVQHAERHRAQLDIYRQAAAQLLNLPITEVKCKIIFSHVGQVVEL